MGRVVELVDVRVIPTTEAFVQTLGTVTVRRPILVGDEALVERIRELSETLRGEVGISAWNGFAMARFCAQDAARLRQPRYHFG